MRANPKLQVVAPSEGVIEDLPALIAPGEYRVRMIYWSVHLLFGRRPKLALWFEICDFGDALGTRIARWYNIRKASRLGKYGNFRVGWSSDLVREYAHLIGWPMRTDRIPLNRYENLLLVAKVGTVTQSRRQETLPACAQYSVIQQLLGVEAGNVAGFHRPSPIPQPVPVPTPTSEPPGPAPLQAAEEM